MASLATFSTQLKVISKKIDEITSGSLSSDDEDVDMEDEEGGDDEDEDGELPEKKKRVLEHLREASNVVREAQSSPAVSTEELSTLLKEVDAIFSQFIDFAYGESEWYDSIPSFADTGDDGAAPLVSDPLSESIQSANVMGHVGKLFHMMLMRGFANLEGTKKAKEEALKIIEGVDYNPKDAPSKFSTRVAHFRPPKSDAPKYPAEQVLATSIAQARCEVYSSGTYNPIQLVINRDATHLAVLGCGGYKDRDPQLDFFSLEAGPGNFDSDEVTLGFGHIAHEAVFHDDMKLLVLADQDRIKTYQYGTGTKLLPTHTLHSRSSGPLLVANDGKLARAGDDGKIRIWDLTKAPTHGKKGKTKIGKSYDSEDSWRDEHDEIEGSRGSPADLTFKFEGFGNEPYIPKIFTPVPSSYSGTTGIENGVLSVNSDVDEASSSVVLHDFSRNGYPVRRWIGHGGFVSSIKLSRDDPTMFVTAASDGYARLFDIRERKALPIMSLAAVSDDGMCGSAIMIHANGQPFVITDAKEGIKFWDIRQGQSRQGCLYELSTGNNQVTAAGLAWDHVRNTLWASTECAYVGRMGDHFDYRKAKLPKWNNDVILDKKSDGEDKGKGKEEDQGIGAKPEKSASAMEEVDDEGDEEDWEDTDDEGDEDEDDYFEGRCWPKRAFHNEKHFGYNFDAGNHRVYNYVFKEQPDLRHVPVYGDATLDRDDGF